MCRLREEKQKYFEDFKTTEQSREYFTMFVEKWNSGSLPGNIIFLFLLLF